MCNPKPSPRSADQIPISGTTSFSAAGNTPQFGKYKGAIILEEKTWLPLSVAWAVHLIAR